MATSNVATSTVGSTVPVPTRYNWPFFCVNRYGNSEIGTHENDWLDDAASVVTAFDDWLAGVFVAGALSEGKASMGPAELLEEVKSEEVTKALNEIANVGFRPVSAGTGEERGASRTLPTIPIIEIKKPNKRLSINCIGLLYIDRRVFSLGSGRRPIRV